VRTHNTKSGTVSLSPEMARNQMYNASADVYAFGILLFEVITELPPSRTFKTASPTRVSRCWRTSCVAQPSRAARPPWKHWRSAAARRSRRQPARVESRACHVFPARYRRSAGRLLK
jgi:serine/threonine protein kinase